MLPSVSTDTGPVFRVAGEYRSEYPLTCTSMFLWILVAAVADMKHYNQARRKTLNSLSFLMALQVYCDEDVVVFSNEITHPIAAAIFETGPRACRRRAAGLRCLSRRVPQDRRPRFSVGGRAVHLRAHQGPGHRAGAQPLPAGY